MKDIKNIKATGNYVVLKMVVKDQDEGMYKKKKSGLYVPNQEEEQAAPAGGGKMQLDHALVHEVGPDVKDPGFKVGDKVVFNEYDIKYVGRKENMFGITKAESIMATYEDEEIEEE